MYLKVNGSERIAISMIHQTKTYAGLLCGFPDKEMNDDRIKEALEEGNQRLFNSTQQKIKTTLIEPHISFHKTNNFSGEEFEYPVLPAYTTTLLIDDISQERQAIIVLYMDKLFNLEEVQHLIKDVDWLTISEEFCW